MSKIKLTKGELKRQRDSLEQFEHYLPTLQLKKQQLQMKIFEIRKNLSRCVEESDLRKAYIEKWSGLFADPELDNVKIDFKDWLAPKEIIAEKTNIAGANVRIFKEVVFKKVSYDFYLAPFWIDKGLEQMRALVSLITEKLILEEQIAILSNELRVTTQRVNLFEKVKIPECLENIRRIRIYLGDQMANAVGIGKVAKKKIEAKETIVV